MKIILLSGGSGKRLWPLSNDTRSKQFLKMLPSESDSNQSMVQRVWKQLSRAGLAESSFIATSVLQKEMINIQLGEDIPIITEPERRDTYPAILLASTYLYSEIKCPEEEVVVILPVDPYVTDGFFEEVLELENLLKKSDADMALIGVKPTYPSTKYGYIVPKTKRNKEYYEVEKFVEKPDEIRSKELIKENALWNCGIFAFKLSYLINKLREDNIPTDYDSVQSSYSDLPSISFDYKVVENAKKIVVREYNGSWKDLGTWNTLTEEMGTNIVGKGKIDENSSNTHLINELDIPVTVIGANNLIIATSADGILVSDKKLSPTIKNVINDYGTRPMYEERIWGWSKTLDYTSYDDGTEVVTRRIKIDANKNSSYHYHELRDEVWTIINGVGELVHNDKITRVKTGDVIHLPSNTKHAIKAISDLEFIEVQTGKGFNTEDNYRIHFIWEDILDEFKNSKSKFINSI